MADEVERGDIQIPVPNFRSNHIGSKLVLFNEKGEIDRSRRSPDAASLVKPSSPQLHNVNHCICGNPCYIGQKSCESCEGKNSIHLEGEIFKK